MDQSQSSRNQIYDLLYCDLLRVQSIYAQTYEGWVDSTQRSYQTNDSEALDAESGGEIGGKGEVDIDPQVGPVRIGTIKGQGDLRGRLNYKSSISATVGESRTDTVNPLHLHTSELIHELLSVGAPSYEEASNGQLFHEEGTVNFIDRKLFKFGLSGFSSMLDVLPPEMLGLSSKQGKCKQRDQKQQMERIVEVLSAYDFPSTMFLKLRNGKRLASTIVDENMIETISAFHLKHGKRGLSNIHVIGIKEESSENIDWEYSEVLGGINQVSSEIGKFLFSHQDTYFQAVFAFRSVLSYS